MANNTFENTIMQSIQIACLSSIRDDGLLSDRQYDELIERISEKNSREAEKSKGKEMKKAAIEEMEQQMMDLFIELSRGEKIAVVENLTIATALDSQLAR